MNAPAVYADVPYANRAHAQSHPDLLATGARLRGVQAPDPATARVLELGCNAGANLIAIAYAFPDATVVGIDYAPSAIAVARETARRLRLTNAAFEVADIRDLTTGRLGAFDFVLAHGIYAWVPDDVREALVQAVAAHLRPRGLAYLSYNAQPGGHLRRVLREAALWYGRAAATRAEQAQAARELFDLLRDVRGGREATDWYGAGLDTELAYLATGEDALLVHDLLADAWSPGWVTELAGHAARHGLAYLGPARLDDHRRARRQPEAGALRAAAGPDAARQDALLDLLTFRRFRESVLCHAAAAGPGEGARGGEPPAAPWLALRFTSAPKAPAADDDPGAAAVARALDAAWPLNLGAAELRAATGLDDGALATALERAFDAGLADPHVALPSVAIPGERPRASALARLQATGPEPLTTLYHGSVFMDDPLGRALVALCDGTRDRAALHRDFVASTGAQVAREVVERNLASLGRIPLFHG